MNPDNTNQDMPRPEASQSPKPQTATEYLNGIMKARDFTKPAKDIADVIADPDYLRPNEKISMAIRMSRELTSAGVETPDNINELSTKYIEWLAEKKRQESANSNLPEWLAERKNQGVFSEPQATTIETHSTQGDARENKTRYNTNREINSLLFKYNTEPSTFTSDEEGKLIGMLRAKLESAQMYSPALTSIKALADVYGELRRREIATGAGWDYEKFSKEHPIVTLKNIQTQEIATEEADTNGIKQAIEQQNGVGERLAIITVADKGEDSVGVSVGSDGKLNLAVADGVSGTILPKFASRTAVEVALEDMEKREPSLDTFKAVHDAIQDADLPSMDSNLDKSLRERQTIEQDPIKQVTFQNWRTTNEKLREKNAISNTTLALAQYDKDTGYLRIAVKGDSSVVVFKNDGTFSRFFDPNNSQLGYNLNPDSKYTPRGEKIEDILLEPDDVVLLCSDGADEGHYKNIFEDINTRLVTSRGGIAGERLDQVIASFIKEKLKTGIGDDVSVIALQHK